MDLDGNAHHDAYEPTFAGVTVTLFDDADVEVGSADTDADGFYEFLDLGAGTYRVVVDAFDVDAGFTASVDPDAVIDDETTVSVAVSEAVDGIDFGYAGTATIGDTVWIDENEDGVPDDDEARIPNVGVTVTWAGLDGVFGTEDDHDFGTRFTDADGWYVFDRLPAGVYRVVVDSEDVPLEVTPTTPTDVTTTVGAGETWVLADFGFASNGELPFTGLDAEHLVVLAALMLGLGSLVLADGRKRERRFDIALDRIDRGDDGRS
jgi:hypothetical protein